MSNVTSSLLSKDSALFVSSLDVPQSKSDARLRLYAKYDQALNRKVSKIQPKSP